MKRVIDEKTEIYYPSGWINLMLEAQFVLEAGMQDGLISGDLKITSVTEKDGMLTIEAVGGNDKSKEVINHIEQMSGAICQLCGEYPAFKVENRTLCDRCKDGE